MSKKHVNAVQKGNEAHNNILVIHLDVMDYCCDEQ